MMKDGADFLSVALKTALAAACAAFVVSCSSVKEPDSVYEEPDYTRSRLHLH